MKKKHNFCDVINLSKPMYYLPSEIAYFTCVIAQSNKGNNTKHYLN